MIVRQFSHDESNLYARRALKKKFSQSILKFGSITLFLFVFIAAHSQKTYYIDPTYTGNTQNGTLQNPYNSFSDFKWENGSTYLLKCSTSTQTTSTIELTGDNLTLGSYGTGDRPVIQSNDPSGNRVLVIRGSNNRVMNLDVKAKENTPEKSAGAVIDMIGSKNPTLENCKSTGGIRGINISKTTGTARVLNCFITDTWDDGMYNRENETIIIENTHVERVNMKFHINPDQTYAGGDGIQFDYLTHFEIRNCTIDKTYTGGKFFIIADHFDTGIIESTTMTGGSQQNGVYIGIGNALTYRDNFLTGGQIGLWNKTANVDAYYNIFKKTGQEAYSGADKTTSKLYNNLFIECATGIKAWSENIKLYNNIFYKNGKDFDGNRSLLEADFNCYYPSKANSTEAHSISADPLFNNPASNDYALKSASPCIEKGKIIPGLSADRASISVPCGSTAEIGPFEFGESPASSPSPNHAPVINLKYDKSVYGGKVITLDASGSSDQDNDQLIYLWESKNQIQLSGNNQTRVSFLAPDKASTETISFRLTLNDGKTSQSTDFSIEVRPYKPEISRINIPAVEASAYDNLNIPKNAVDNNIQTRWSAEGDNNWLKVELNGKAHLSHLKIAYYGGSHRKGYFDLCGSMDKVNWEPILQKASTCGFSEDKEVFDIPENLKYNDYKFLRVTGHNNSENSWNSIAEILIFGEVSNEEKPNDIDNSLLKNSFSVYPNPSNGEFNLYFPDELEKNVQSVIVYSMNGKAVFKKDFSITTGELHINHDLADGVYLLQVQFSDKSQSTEKILVRR